MSYQNRTIRPDKVKSPLNDSWLNKFEGISAQFEITTKFNQKITQEPKPHQPASRNQKLIEKQLFNQTDFVQINSQISQIQHNSSNQKKSVRQKKVSQINSLEKEKSQKYSLQITRTLKIQNQTLKQQINQLKSLRSKQKDQINKLRSQKVDYQEKIFQLERQNKKLLKQLEKLQQSTQNDNKRQLNIQKQRQNEQIIQDQHPQREQQNYLQMILSEFKQKLFRLEKQLFAKQTLNNHQRYQIEKLKNEVNQLLINQTSLLQELQYVLQKNKKLKKSYEEINVKVFEYQTLIHQLQKQKQKKFDTVLNQQTSIKDQKIQKSLVICLQFNEKLCPLNENIFLSHKEGQSQHQTSQLDFLQNDSHNISSELQISKHYTQNTDNEKLSKTRITEINSDQIIDKTNKKAYFIDPFISFEELSALKQNLQNLREQNLSLKQYYNIQNQNILNKLKQRQKILQITLLLTQNLKQRELNLENENNKLMEQNLILQSHLLQLQNIIQLHKDKFDIKFDQISLFIQNIRCRFQLKRQQ